MQFFTEFARAVWEIIKLPFTLISVALRRVFRLGLYKITLLIAAGILLVGVIGFTFLKVSSDPKFCSSCHLMRPYIEAWENSSHANVDCMSCHARAGLSGYFETKFTAVSMLANYATGLYRRSRPWAEIEDENCLQCHDTRLLEGKIEWIKGITFDHTPHLAEKRRGRKLRCTSCHSQIVQGEHISVTASTCYLCHFKNIEKAGRGELAECQKCHINPPEGNDALEAGLFDHSDVLHDGITCKACHQKMWQGSGGVRRESCGTCHAKVEHIDRIDDLEFIHEWHIEKRKVDCQICHDSIEHQYAGIDEDIRSQCSNCHTDKHSGTSMVFQGKGAKLIDVEMPDPMYKDRVVCISCHKNGTTSHVLEKIGDDACMPCHDKAFVRLTKDWKKSFNQQVAGLERAIKRSKAHPKLEDAKHDLALIKQGGAWHNPPYAQAVLEQITLVVQEAGGNPNVLPHTPPESHKCFRCHSSVKTMTVTLAGSNFDHLGHLSIRDISCMNCHPDVTPDTPGHGSRLPVGESCQKCHHGVKSEDNDMCVPCHSASRHVYTGDVGGYDGGPSPMADGGMVCSDCHDSSGGFAPPKDEFCMDCHDEEIVEQLNQYRDLFSKAIPGKSMKSTSLKFIKNDNGRAVHHPDLVKKLLGLQKSKD